MVSLAALMTSNFFYPYNFPQAKLTQKNYLNEYYFYEDAFTQHRRFLYVT